MSIVIAGAGNFGREMAGWFKMLNQPIKGFIDDSMTGTIKNYKPALGEQVLVCISNPKGRQSVANSLIERNVVFHNFSMCILATTARRGVGCIFCPQSLMSNDSQVGDFVIVNVFSSIGHDVKVGSFTTLSSYVDLTGNVTVGERCFFGSGARVLPGVTIGNDCIVGAGAIVVSDLADNTTVYAAPARKL